MKTFGTGKSSADPVPGSASVSGSRRTKVRAKTALREQAERGKCFFVLAEAGVKYRFPCERVVDGVPVNPVLPAGFDDTPHGRRSPKSLAWWGVPFIRVEHCEDPEFVKTWKGALRYDVRCLDGGAWDRSTCWGSFATLQEAVAQAKRNCPVWLNQ
jgi:hypothetical protein